MKNVKEGEVPYIQKPETDRRPSVFSIKVTTYTLFKLVLIISTLTVIISLTLDFSQRREQKTINHAEESLEKELIVKDLTAAAVEKFNLVSSSLSQPRNEVLILYAYYETRDSRVNIVHFFRHGLHASADFIFIINGESNVDQLLPQKASNIRVVRRNNSCFDIGSHGDVLQVDDYRLVREYKRFILMNGSVRGPFLPTYVTSCWTDMFLQKINDEVKLVGTTYNYWAEHIQSMVLATDRIGLRILLAGNDTDSTLETDVDYMGVYEGNPTSLIGLSKCPATKFRAVSAEISLTSLIRRAGYKIAVFMTSANSAQIQGKFDYQTNIKLNSYNLASVHPYEVIFIKARTGWEDSMNIDLLSKLTEWHNHLNYSSWEACKLVDERLVYTP